MPKNRFDDLLERVVQHDPRYHREAYLFIREALSHTQSTLAKLESKPTRHVSAQQLLEGIREHALAQYGPMAVTVLEYWGVYRCEDFGELVFNLIHAKVLRKTEKDSKEDFAKGYDFFDAFVKPFLPSRRSHGRLAPGHPSHSVSGPTLAG